LSLQLADPRGLLAGPVDIVIRATRVGLWVTTCPRWERKWQVKRRDSVLLVPWA
jgi:hypothetical protein